MDRYYPSQVDGDVVMGALESGEGFLLVAGRPPVDAIALPLTKWRDSDAVKETYDLDKTVRIGLSDLSASLITRLVMSQVDENWKPFGRAILTLSGRDVLLLVPANDYWREKVRGEQ